MFRIIRYAVALIGFLVVMTVVGTVAAVALVLAESSRIEGCELADGAEVAVQHDPALAAAFQSKLDGVIAALEAGQPVSVSFSNDEVSSRATTYLAGQRALIEDVTVCFEPGLARASATFADLLGRDVTVQVEGSVDLSGDHPRLQLSSVKAGKLPLVGPLRDLVESRINDVLDDLPLDHTLNVSSDYDAALVEAEPGRP